MTGQWHRLLSIIILTLPAAGAFATSEAGNRWSHCLHKIQGYDSRIVQTVRDENRQLVSRSRGRLEIRLPAYLRLEFTAPERELLLLDNNSLHYYEQELEQMVISKLPAANPLLAMLRGDMKTVQQTYRLKLSRERNGNEQYHLQHRQQASTLFPLQLWFWLQKCQIVKLAWSDSLGQYSELEIGKSAGIPPLSRFEFTPPPATDIIHRDE